MRIRVGWGGVEREGGTKGDSEREEEREREREREREMTERERERERDYQLSEGKNADLKQSTQKDRKFFQVSLPLSPSMTKLFCPSRHSLVCSALTEATIASALNSQLAPCQFS